VLVPTVMILPPSARCGTEAKRLGHGAVVRLGADFHPSRRGRGKSGKDSRVGASRPLG